MLRTSALLAQPGFAATSARSPVPGMASAHRATACRVDGRGNNPTQSHGIRAKTPQLASGLNFFIERFGQVKIGLRHTASVHSNSSYVNFIVSKCYFWIVRKALSNTADLPYQRQSFGKTVRLIDTYKPLTRNVRP